MDHPLVPPSSCTATAGSTDEMDIEVSMAEDAAQSCMLAAAVNDPQPISPSQTALYQLDAQQNQAAPQNPSAFRASGSLEFGPYSGSLFGNTSSKRLMMINSNRNRTK